MSATLSLDSVVRVAPDQLSCDLEGEAVLLNLKLGMYYGLEEVGARVWKLIQRPQSLRAVRDVLLEEYDVASEVLELDLIQLLTKMEAAGLVLVELADAPST